MDLPRAWMRQLAGAAGAIAVLPALLLIVAAGVIVGGGGSGLGSLGQLIAGPAPPDLPEEDLTSAVGSAIARLPGGGDGQAPAAAGAGPAETAETARGGQPARGDGGSRGGGTGGGGTRGGGGRGGEPGGGEPGGGGGEGPAEPESPLDQVSGPVTDVTDEVPAPLGPVAGDLVDGLVDTAEDLLGSGGRPREDFLVPGPGEVR